MTRSYLREWMLATKVSSSARVVFLALALHADQSDRAWPSTTTIGAETGHGCSTVRRALRELEQAGDVTAEERPGLSTVYQLCPHPAESWRGTPPKSGAHPRPIWNAPPPDSDRDPRPNRAPKVLKTTKDVLKGRSSASPQNGAAARTAASAPVMTRDDGATFLPGTGWLS